MAEVNYYFSDSTFNEEDEKIRLKNKKEKEIEKHKQQVAA